MLAANAHKSNETKMSDRARRPPSLNFLTLKLKFLCYSAQSPFPSGLTFSVAHHHSLHSSSSLTAKRDAVPCIAWLDEEHGILVHFERDRDLYSCDQVGSNRSRTSIPD